MNNLIRNARVLLLITFILASASASLAQGTTAFTYQGQLRDGGTNANGAYTMIFKLYDSLNGGNQIGSDITSSPTLFNGLFSVNLDFGAGAFNGGARWLDITVSNGVAQTLSPRVGLLPTPYAQFAAVAATVTNGAIKNTQLAGSAVNGTNIATGQVIKSLNGLSDLVSLAAGANITLTTNGQILSIAGAGGSSGGTNYIPTLTHFSSNGTFIVPSGVTRILVEMWGGGGGGGNGSNSDCGTLTGGGGGGGSYSKFIFNVTPGASYPVTVGLGGSGSTGTGGSGGTGGTTSLGGLISATGGNGGGDAPSGCTGFCGGNQGSGGDNNGSTGYLNIAGGSGESGCSDAIGGTAALGGPGGQGHGGADGSSPGGGGGGADPNNTSHGGNGANGLVIIYY